jgi:hypothetical protein
MVSTHGQQSLRQSGTSGQINEYHVLRDELMNRDRNALTALTALLAGTGAFLGFGGAVVPRLDDVQLAWFALSGSLGATFFMIPLFQYVKANMQSSLRIGVYIRTFIEPSVAGLDWERRIANFRKISGSGWSQSYSVGFLALGIALSSLGAIGILLALGIDRWSVSGLAVLTLGSVYQASDLIFRFSPGWKAERFWIGVREQEDGSNADR